LILQKKRGILNLQGIHPNIYLSFLLAKGSVLLPPYPQFKKKAPLPPNSGGRKFKESPHTLNSRRKPPYPPILGGENSKLNILGGFRGLFLLLQDISQNFYL
jgi:hypothetical protein